MRVQEFGTENSRVILFLHGGGLSWWNYREEAALLQQEFHVVIPVLDGHAGSDRHFSTIADNAEGMISYIDAHFGGSVWCIGGLSLGAQILVEMLSRRKDICQYAVIESALVIPSEWMKRMILPAFGASYGLVKQRWFARLQFASLKIRKDLFEDYYRDSCRIAKEDMIAFLEENSVYRMKEALRLTRANTAVIVGGREQQKMKKSAKLLQAAIPGSRLYVLPGFYHGDFSINHAGEYVELLRKLMAVAKEG